MTVSVSGKHCVAYQETVSRLHTHTHTHECERSRIPTNISSLRSVVHTKFYGSARRRLLHWSFLFASGKYLTSYSGPFWQLPRLSLYLNRPRRSIHRPYVRSAWILGSLFFGIDRMLHDPFRGGISIKYHVYAFPRWDDAKSTVITRIHDTDSLELLWSVA